MTAVQTTASPPPASVPTKEEQPAAIAYEKRYTGLKLLGIAVVWVVGWAVFKNHDTLATPFQQLNGFHRWINHLHDDIQASAQTMGG